MQHQSARRRFSTLPINGGCIDDRRERKWASASEEAWIASRRRAIPTERRGVGRHG
jgi:hypothetical protein